VDLVRVENRIKDLSVHLIPEAAQELNVPVEAYPGEQSPTKPVLPLVIGRQVRYTGHDLYEVMVNGKSLCGIPFDKLTHADQRAMNRLFDSTKASNESVRDIWTPVLD